MLFIFDSIELAGPPALQSVPSPPPYVEQVPPYVKKEEWKSAFSLPAISTLALIDLKSEKPALKHLRKQFCLSLVQDNDEDEDSEEELSDIEEKEDSMEVKNYFPSPFVRHGFGRVSCNTTTSSSYQSSDNLNCVEEMEASENEVTSVEHCISKFNANSSGTEKTTKTMTSKSYLQTITLSELSAAAQKGKTPAQNSKYIGVLQVEQWSAATAPRSRA